MRLLVVDDNFDLAMTLAEFLRQEGHEVTTAYDGGSALMLAADVRFDGVILDLGLPDQSGYDVALKLGGFLHHHSVVVLFTANSDPVFDVAAAVGVDMIVRKPLEPAALAEMLVFLRKRKLDVPSA